ncbi:hypothetical protein EalM132_00128 [Exiguobacterium phage vB_EalM-132]|nr:hypothetical protein EalM132_00128 [Exiguobacterium phage vB_EalM-132]
MTKKTYQRNYTWNEERQETLTAYIENSVPFIARELAEEWNMHPITMAKRIREICQERGYHASNTSSNKKPVVIDKNPSPAKAEEQTKLIRKYGNQN